MDASSEKKPAVLDAEQELRDTLLAVRAKLKVALHLSKDRGARRRRFFTAPR